MALGLRLLAFGGEDIIIFISHHSGWILCELVFSADSSRALS